MGCKKQYVTDYNNDRVIDMTKSKLIYRRTKDIGQNDLKLVHNILYCLANNINVNTLKEVEDNKTNGLLSPLKLRIERLEKNYVKQNNTELNLDTFNRNYKTVEDIPISLVFDLLDSYIKDGIEKVTLGATDIKSITLGIASLGYNSEYEEMLEEDSIKGYRVEVINGVRMLLENIGETNINSLAALPNGVPYVGQLFMRIRSGNDKYDVENIYMISNVTDGLGTEDKNKSKINDFINLFKKNNEVEDNTSKPKNGYCNDSYYIDNQRINPEKFLNVLLNYIDSLGIQLRDLDNKYYIR